MIGTHCPFLFNYEMLYILKIRRKQYQSTVACLQGYTRMMQHEQGKSCTNRGMPSNQPISVRASNLSQHSIANLHLFAYGKFSKAVASWTKKSCAYNKKRTQHSWCGGLLLSQNRFSLHFFGISRFANSHEFRPLRFTHFIEKWFGTSAAHGETEPGKASGVGSHGIWQLWEKVLVQKRPVHNRPLITSGESKPERPGTPLR